jgi:Tfp pilus assembly protein PilP
MATLLALLPTEVLAQDDSTSAPEVMKIWLESEVVEPPKSSESASNDDEVFTATDEFDEVSEDGNEPTGAKPSIQTVDTDRLTLVAVIIPEDKRDTKSKVAMVGYNGHDYEIKEGTKIGPNNGYVKEIADTYVIIGEERINEQGETRDEEILLQLPE